MELNKCSRCGAFHTNGGDVCPKCAAKDNLELSTFKNYIEQNGLSSVDTIATETGISQKNVARFLEYQNFENNNPLNIQNLSNSGVVLN